MSHQLLDRLLGAQKALSRDAKEDAEHLIASAIEILTSEEVKEIFERREADRRQEERRKVPRFLQKEAS